MAENFFRVRPDPHDAGWRIRIERAEGELTLLTEEKVFPERVQSPHAQHVDAKDSIWLTADDVRWLHDQLGDLVAVLDAEEAREGAPR